MTYDRLPGAPGGAGAGHGPVALGGVAERPSAIRARAARKAVFDKADVVKAPPWP